MQGSMASYAVNLSSTDGFSQLAALSVAGLPSGATASFAPAQITAGESSILTVSMPAGQSVGNTTLTVTAAANVDGTPTSHSSTVTLVVTLSSTALIGRVVESDPNESPLGGITITLLGLDDAGHVTGCTGQVVSDAAGNFGFTNLPAACTGRQLVAYNGNTATDGEKYASVNLAYTMTAGQITGPELVHLPNISDGETVMVQQNAPNDQTITFKTMPGVVVTVYAGTIFTLPDGTQPNPFPLVGVQVPVDRLPDTPIDGPGSVRAYIVAFQPADTTTNQPVPVTFPNTLNTPVGVNMDLETLDPVVGELVKYGTATVSADGVSIVPDSDPAHPGHRFGISHFDWHGPFTPLPNARNPSPDRCSPQCGDPVDVASGLLVENDIDLVFGGARGQVFLKRTYRSLSASPGPFGPGTGHNYFYQLDLRNFLNGGAINLDMPDGNVFALVRQQDGTLSTTGVPWLQGAVMTVSGAPATGPAVFTLRFKDGTLYTFQSSFATLPSAYLNLITDRNGNSITLKRDNANSIAQITQIVDPVGRSATLSYDASNRIVSIVDPIGRTVTYTYNNGGMLETVTDPAGGVTKYTYDAQNRLAAITDPRGITFVRNSYDENGMVRQQEDANGGITTLAYTLLNPNGAPSLGGNNNANTSPVLLTTVTDPLGNTTNYHFSPQGFLLDVTDALGQKTIYTRDPKTNKTVSITDPLNRTTTLVDDALGNLVSETDLDGTPQAVTTTYTYEPVFNQVLTVTNPLKHTTTLTYDAAGNLKTIADPLGHTSSLTYDSFGELTARSDALGHTATFAYTGGDLTSVADALNNQSTFAYDGLGRLISRTTPLGQTTRYTYDNLGQVIRVTDPLGDSTSYSYDANGNRLSVTDSLGHTTTASYDFLNRPAARTDALSRQSSFSYDLAGNLTQVTDRRGKTTVFRYDALNRLVFTGFGANGGSFESSIDSSGLDAGNHLTRVVDSNSGVITRSYDGLDRLVQEVTPQGSVSYNYDAAGRQTGMTVAGQPPVTYSYDDAGRLVQIQQPGATVGLTYDDANRRSTVSLPNSITKTYAYDAASQLTGITYTQGITVIGDLTYKYDARGKRSEVGGSLAHTDLPQAISSASYDPANELTNWNGTTISYDANGNMLSDGRNSFTWNARNQAATINGASPQYDAFGRRIANTTGKSFLFDGLNAVQNLSGDAATANLLTGGLDELLQRSDGNGTVVPLTDALGSTLALADTTGSLVTSYSYDPFGNSMASGTPSANTAQFTGRENEGNGLYYYRARYYSPLLQRFVSEDPLGSKGGDINFYAYVQNDPINYGDPSGLVIVVDPHTSEGDESDEMVYKWFSNQVDQVTDIIATQDGMKAVINGLINSPYDYHITLGGSYLFDDRPEGYFPHNRVLGWNPHRSRCVNGRTLSPADIMAHFLRVAYKNDQRLRHPTWLEKYFPLWFPIDLDPGYLPGTPVGAPHVDQLTPDGKYTGHFAIVY
jgi:RHS repeat-associated protein